LSNKKGSAFTGAAFAIRNTGLIIMIVVKFSALTFYRAHFFVPCRICAPVYAKCK